MKNFLFIVILIFATTTSFAQKTNMPKSEKKGDLTEITLYYDNGEIMQHGFYNKKGELHGGWESYNDDGSRKCVAFYEKGEKVGTWFYYKNGEKTKVIYEKNKIVKIEKMDGTKKEEIDNH